MTSHDLQNTALTLVAEGKGILAADETVPTLTRRFDALGIQSTEQSRRTYREMLFTAPGAADFISGTIMYDETIRQKNVTGTPLAQVLADEAFSPASRSIPARNPSPALLMRLSPRGSTVCGSASPSTTAWAPASRSGGLLFISQIRCRAPLA
jgi:hypothetical protein